MLKTSSKDCNRDSGGCPCSECNPRAVEEPANTIDQVVDQIVDQKPLTPNLLTKMLSLLAVALFATSSVCTKHVCQALHLLNLFYKVFIGLFADAQHKLSLEHDRIDRTTTISATATSTSIFTSTIVATTTVAPSPEPTKAPEEVRLMALSQFSA